MQTGDTIPIQRHDSESGHVPGFRSVRLGKGQPQGVAAALELVHPPVDAGLLEQPAMSAPLRHPSFSEHHDLVDPVESDQAVRHEQRRPALGQATDLHIEVAPGTYYWSVQAIDSGFMASPWTAEQSCRYCPGDLDDSGDVDLSDLATLLANYGTTSGASYEDGDLDGDGDVDLQDLAALLSVYGMTC